MLVVIELVQALSHVHYVPRHDGRLVLLAGVLNHVREPVEKLGELVGAFGRKVAVVETGGVLRLLNRILSRLFDYAGAPCMGVLNVRARLAVKVENLVPLEGVVLDAVVGKLLEYYGADSNFLCNLVDVEIGVLVLFGNDLSRLFNGLV